MFTNKTRLKTSLLGTSKNCPDARRPANEPPERTSDVREDGEFAGNNADGRFLEVPHISIVLIEPRGDENVGMTARAMKNFCITDLRLVNPKPFKTKGALKWACSASDIMSNAKEFKTLKDALKDSSLVVGFSRRHGKLRPQSVPLLEALAKICSRARRGSVSFVFGREADGLEKAHLDECDFVASIPTSKEAPSLNLAQAVLIVCYEVFKKTRKIKRQGNNYFVSRAEFFPAIERLDEALVSLDYDENGGRVRKKIIKSFEDMFGRAGVRHKDVNMFLGLSERIKQKTKGL